LLALGLGLAGGAIFVLRQQALAKQGSAEPPPPGHSRPLLPAEQESLERATADLHGFLIWSSNRFGNHELIRMALPDRKLTRLTHDPHVDYFPRISPNGLQLVFARSREPWVSWRRSGDWDIWWMDLESGEERRLAERGFTPSWSEDGETVYFQRHLELGQLVASQFVACRLEDGAERILFESGKGAIPGGALLSTPSLNSRNGTLAVTLRGSTRMAGFIPREGPALDVGDGCQLAWSRDTSFAYYIDGPGRQKNALYRVDPATGERTLWLDLPGEYSHEYFPRTSNDDRYMVLGASRGGREHEHDSADYEIFLWRVGASAEDAVRLTYHSGNDNWPDLYLAE